MVDLRTISLGAGVQSTALYLMALDGILEPMPDVAIFADTQREPPWVYENLVRLEREGRGRLPIHIASVGDLGDSVRNQMKGGAGGGGKRFASVPFWTKDPESGSRGSGRRQCTREYKIEAVVREVRRILGLKKGERAAGKYSVEEWVGISMDEAQRAKPSRYAWITTRWPLLMDVSMRRHQISEWLAARGWPELKKSACVFCPYRSALEWADWREHEPEMWAEALRWDEEIRFSGSSGPERPQYITDRLVPLKQMPTRAELEKERDWHPDLFGNECEGMCGL